MTEVDDSGNSRPGPRVEFYRTLGVEVSLIGMGESAVVIASQLGLQNSRDELHGGAVLAMADIAATNAVRSCVAANARMATVSVTLNFVAPCRAPARAVGRVVARGGRLVSVDLGVTSADGAVVAHGVATVRVFSRATTSS